MAWTAAQKAWLKKNDPAKLARGYENRKKGPSLPAKKPAGGGGGGGGLKWNANELAWAKKHGVNLGQKTAGGLSTNAAYKRITGGGNQQQQPKGHAKWVGKTPERTELVKGSANPFDDRVAGKDVQMQGDKNYTSEGYGKGKRPTDWTAYGEDKVNQDLKWHYNNVVKQGKDSKYSQDLTYNAFLKKQYEDEGMYQNRVKTPQEKKAPAVARVTEAPPPAAPLPPVEAPIEEGEREFVTPPASGLEDTINIPTIKPPAPPLDYRDPEQNAPGSGYGEYKKRPSYLTMSDEERRRRSFLTAGA